MNDIPAFYSSFFFVNIDDDFLASLVFDWSSSTPIEFLPLVPRGQYSDSTPAVILSPFVSTLSLAEASPFSPFIPIATLTFVPTPYVPPSPQPKAEKNIDYKHGYNTTFVIHDALGQTTPFYLSQLDPSKSHIFNDPNGRGDSVLVFSNGADVVFYDLNGLANGYFSGVVNRNIFVAGSGIGTFDLAQGNDTVYLYNSFFNQAGLNTTIQFSLVNMFKKTIDNEGLVQGTLTFYLTPYDDVLTVDSSLTAISSGIGYLTFNGGAGSNTMYMNTFTSSTASYLINANANSLNNSVYNVGISNFQNITITTGSDSMVTFARGVVNNGVTISLLDTSGDARNDGILVGSNGHDYFNLSNFVGFNRLVTWAGRDTVYGDIYLYDAIYGNTVNFDDWEETTTAKEDTIYAISSANAAIVTFNIEQYNASLGTGAPVVLIRGVDTLYLSSNTAETVYTGQGSNAVSTVNTVYGQSADSLSSGINALPTTLYLNMQGTGNNAQNIPAYYGFGSLGLDTANDVIYAAFLGSMGIFSAGGDNTLYLYSNTGMTMYNAGFESGSSSITTTGIQTIYSMNNNTIDVFYYSSNANISSINKLGSGRGIFYGDANALTLYANRASSGSTGTTLSAYGLSTFYLGNGGTTVYYESIPNQSTIYAPSFYGGTGIDVFYGSTSNDYIAALANFTSVNLIAGNNTLWYIPVQGINTVLNGGSGSMNTLYVNNIGLDGTSGFAVSEYIGAANALGGANFMNFQSIYFFGSMHTIYHVDSRAGTYLNGSLADTGNTLYMVGTVVPTTLYLGRTGINSTGLTVEGMETIYLSTTLNDTVYVVKPAQTSFINASATSTDSLYFVAPVSSLALTGNSVSDSSTSFSNFSRIYLQNTNTFTLNSTNTVANTTFYAGSGQAIFQGGNDPDVLYSNYANLTTPGVALVDFTIIRTGNGNDSLYTNYVLQSQLIDMGGGTNNLYVDINGTLNPTLYSTLYLSTLRNVQHIYIKGGTTGGVGATIYSLNANDITHSGLTVYGNMTGYTDTAYLSWAGFSFTASNLLNTFRNVETFYLDNLGSTLTFTRNDSNPLNGVMIVNTISTGTYVDTTATGSTLYVNAMLANAGGLSLQGFGTYTLGAGNDVIYIASGMIATINGGGGSDNRVYTNNLEGVVINSISNIQSLYGAGASDSFTITDTNLINATTSYMHENGASKITFTADAVNISVDSSSSIFTTVMNFSSIYLQGADASVYYAGGSVFGTSLYATSTNATFYGDNNGVSIVLGGIPSAGKANLNGFSTITLGSGNDTVYLSSLGTSTTTLDGGFGNNIFYVLASTARMDFTNNGIGFITGSGSGRINFSHFNTFYMAEGTRAFVADYVGMSFYGNTLHSMQTTVYLGNGDDNAYVSSVAATLTGSVAVMDIASLYLGAGNDEVWFQGDTGNGYFKGIYGQSGNNTFYLNGDLPSQSMVVGGIGNDTVYLTSNIPDNALYLDGGAGFNTLYARGVNLPTTAYTNFNEVITSFSPAGRSADDIDFSLDWDMHVFYDDNVVDYGILNGGHDGSLISYGQYGAMHVDALSGTNLIMDVRGGIHDVLTLTGTIEDSLMAGGSIGYNIKGYEILDMRGVSNNSLYFTDADLFTMAKGSNTGTLTIYTNDIRNFYILDGDTDYTYSYNNATGRYDIFYGDDVVHLILKGR